jgi:hypothetical protein
VRFPDFLEEPEALYDMLPLPASRTRAEFLDAFAAVFDPVAVHDNR